MSKPVPITAKGETDVMFVKRGEGRFAARELVTPPWGGAKGSRNSFSPFRAGGGTGGWWGKRRKRPTTGVGGEGGVRWSVRIPANRLFL